MRKSSTRSKSALGATRTTPRAQKRSRDTFEHEEPEYESENGSTSSSDEKIDNNNNVAATIEDDDEDDEEIAALKELEETVASAPVESNSVMDKTVTFAELGLHEKLCETCAALGYKHPTRVQAATLRAAIQQQNDDNRDDDAHNKKSSKTSNKFTSQPSQQQQQRLSRDIIGIAETGSGKTASFVLPILHHLLSNMSVKPSPGSALVLTPTRELAAQIKDHFDAFGTDIGLKTMLVVGGMDMFRQKLQMEQIKPHVIIGTPGRVCKHLRDTSSFALHNLKFLVLDEADKMLGIEFEDELNQVLQQTDKAKRTTYLFSATMTKKVEKLQKAQMRDPVLVRVTPSKYSTVDSLQQDYLFIPEKFKEVYLTYLLNENAGKRIVLFVSQNATCITLTLMLRALGFPAVPLAGHMKESDRMHCLNKFKSGDKPILVATDVASRGLDIPLIEMVIIYDIPTHSKEYIHRVGRTARAGRKGQAITMVTQYDLEYFQKIEKLIGKKMSEYATTKDDVMVLVNTVTEALRLAKNKVKQKEKISVQKGEDEEEVIYDAVVSLTKKREAKRNRGGNKGNNGAPSANLGSSMRGVRIDQDKDHRKQKKKSGGGGGGGGGFDNKKRRTK